MNIKSTVKKIIPKQTWNFIRHYKAIIRDRGANFGSSACHILYCGFNISYTAGTILIKKIRNGKIFEEKMCALIAADLANHSSPVFLDVGANIGLISIYIRSKIPGVKIYAFEPGPDQHTQFAKTIAENSLDTSITLSNEALADRVGEAAFITHFSQNASGDGFIDTGRAGEPINITVNVTTVDTWWEQADHPHVDVFKIDTEGSELLVLKGAVVFLLKVKPIIYLEIEPKNLRVYPHTREDIRIWLDNNSYDLYTLDGEKCTKETFASFIGAYDTYIAKPRI